MLEHHAETLLDDALLGIIELIHVRLKDDDAPARLRHETEDGAREHGFAGSGSADDADELAAIELEAHVLEDLPSAELDGEVLHVEKRRIARGDVFEPSR